MEAPGAGASIPPPLALAILDLASWLVGIILEGSGRPGSLQQLDGVESLPNDHRVGSGADYRIHADGGGREHSAFEGDHVQSGHERICLCGGIGTCHWRDIVR